MTARTLLTATLVALVGISPPCPAGAAPQLPGDEIQIPPSDPVSNDGTTTRFGASVALDGNVLVVGATQDDVEPAPADARGAVYVFERIDGTWTPLQKLVAPDGADGDQFGHAVDVALGPPGLDDFLIVGAPEASRISMGGPDGKVYLFRRSGDGPWTFETQLEPDPDTEVGSSEFGSDVALDVSVPAASQTGDPLFTAVVGSPYYDRPSTPSENQGAIQIYQLVGSPATWQMTHELYGYRETGTQSGYMFVGWSVDLDGGLIVAGAPYWFAGSPSVQESGVGILYTQGNQQPAGHIHWVEASRLERATPETFDRLGHSSAISMDGSVAMLGSPRYDGFEGGVFVFDVLNAGLVRTEVQILQASDGMPGWNFGESIDIDGPYAVVGAPGAATGATTTGALYFFERTTGQANSWVEVDRITPSDLPPFGEYGAAAAISGLFTATGVPQKSIGPDAPEGVVYLNELLGIFSDGFEGGTTSAWSGAVP